MDLSELLVAAKAIKTTDSEADVREKLVSPLLRVVLRYQSDDWVAEPAIPRLNIDKGRNQKKNWYPDYLVSIEGLYVSVIEAKAPDKSVLEGWDEAHMYADKLNRDQKSRSSIETVVACNGIDLAFAKYGTATSDVVIVPVVDLLESNTDAARFESISGRSYLKQRAEDVRNDRRAKSAFSIRYRRYKNKPPPDDPKNAYTSVLKTLLKTGFKDLSKLNDDDFQAAYCLSNLPTRDRQHENVLRSRPPQGSQADKTNAEEFSAKIDQIASDYVSAFDNSAITPADIVLLLGGAGVGKTTLIQWYLRFGNIASTFCAVYIDGRESQQSIEGLYNSVVQTSIESIEKYVLMNHCEGNLARMMQEVLRQDRERDRMALYSHLSEADYLKVRFPELARSIQDDKPKYLKALIEYLRLKKRPVALILDNLDAATVPEQVDGFKVFKPLGTSLGVFMVMAMRGETWAKCRNVAPFDAYEDLEPLYYPGVAVYDVIQKRIELLERVYGKKQGVLGHATVGNLKLDIHYSGGLELVRAFARALRDDGNVFTPLEGVSGHNIRLGLQCFRTMCGSSRFSSKLLMPAAVASDRINFQMETVVRALMCGRKSVYASDYSDVANVYEFMAVGETRSHFVILHILKYLAEHASDTPATGKGYCGIDMLYEHMLNLYDMSETQLRDILYRYANNKLWQVDTIVPTAPSDFAAVRLEPQGLFILEQLYNDPAYLDMTAFDTPVADQVVRKELFELAKKSTTLDSVFKSYLCSAERNENQRRVRQKKKIIYSTRYKPFLTSLDSVLK